MWKILFFLKSLFIICALVFAFMAAGQSEMAADIEPKCVSCHNYGLGIVCDVKNLRVLADLVVSSLGKLRSPLQIDQYVACQIGARREELASEWLELYQNKYRHYIKAAAKEFNVPPQLLQCAFLKESVYNAEVNDSGAGAQGLCQIMPDTKNHIHNILSNAADRRETGRIYDALDEMEMDLVKPVDRAYYNTIVKHDDLLHMWNQTFIKLDEQGHYPYRSNGEIDLPTGFSSVGVKRPQNCIAAAALYFRDIMSQLSIKIESTTKEQLVAGEGQNASVNLLLIMGAAYNAGPGTVNRLLKEDGSAMTLQEMVDTLEASSNSEMTDYMKSLRSCLDPGNFTPPERWYREGGVAPPTCEEYKEEEANFGLTPVRFWP